jgi:hypothetical protein
MPKALEKAGGASQSTAHPPSCATAREAGRGYNTATERRGYKNRWLQLFHSHTLGEVARFVHVTAELNREMVSKKLQRNDGEN